MFIDKVNAFTLPEEDAALIRLTDHSRQISLETGELLNELDRIKKTYGKESREFISAQEAADAALKKTTELLLADNEQIKKIFRTIEQRYKDSFNYDTDALIADVRETVSAFEKQDFIRWANSYSSLLASYNEIDNIAQEEIDKDLRLQAAKELSKKNWLNCESYIYSCLRIQIEALEEWKPTIGQEAFNTAIGTIDQLIGAKVDKYYKRPKGRRPKTPKIPVEVLPNSKYIPMLNSPVTNALARTSYGQQDITPVRGNPSVGTVTSGELKIFIDGYEKKTGVLRTSTKKLLDTGAMQLTANAGKTTVTFSLKDYARYKGYDVDERPTDTPAEAERERKRIKTQLDNLRKEVTKDLNTLYSISIEWSEAGAGKDKGKMLDFDKRRIVDRTAIKNGNIIMTFSDSVAEYLTHYNYIMQYPKALLAIDERNPSAYTIGRKLALHNSMDNNAKRGTSDIISVEALLAECKDTIPSYDNLIATNNRNWRRLIADRLEQALEILVNNGVLTEWTYCSAKKAPVTDEQLSTTNYAGWSQLYITFKLADAPDQTERRQAKEEAKQKHKDAVERELAKKEASAILKEKENEKR